MQSSGRFATPPPPALPAPYPSRAPGDWRTFMVGVLLIALLLIALAVGPTGDAVVPVAPGVSGIEDMASHAPPPTQALALPERDTQTVDGKRVLVQTETAEGL